MPSRRDKLSQAVMIAVIGGGWPPEEVHAALGLLRKGNGKLPTGRLAPPRELVAALQHARLIAGMLSAAAELGYEELNVQDVLDRAVVSRPTFYKFFADKDDCFVQAFEVAAALLRERTEAAALKGGSWRDRTRLGLAELLRFAADEPAVAHTVIVEARGASTKAMLRRAQLIEHFGQCLDRQARELLPGEPVSMKRPTEAAVSGIEALLYSRVARNQTADLESLLPSLLYLAVLFHEGPDAAGEVLAADRPIRRASSAPG